MDHHGTTSLDFRLNNLELAMTRGLCRFGVRGFYLLISLLLVWLWSVNLGAFKHTFPKHLSELKEYHAKPPLPYSSEEEEGVSSNRTLSERKNRENNSSVPPRLKDEESNAHRGNKFHYVFSTGCSPFQDWQSYSLFFSALKSGLSSETVTRVASGCDPKAADALRKSHQEQIETLSTNFRLHLTPNYSKTIPGKDYKFFNKPFGLRHWMEENLGFPDTTEYDDIIFVILDPDQVIVRPFEADMSPYATAMKWQTEPTSTVKVEEGRPFGQHYGFGADWITKIDKNLSHVLNYVSADEAALSHLHDWTAHEVEQYYTAGPPYIAHAQTMYRIVSTWAKFAVPVYELTDDFLSEMFAYSTAAAHLKLPHQLAYSFMVSNTAVKQEAWSWVDEAAGRQVCASRENYGAISASSPRHYLPNILHFCQRYHLGSYFFSKYKLPKNFLTCDHPLMEEPEIDNPDDYSTSVTPNGAVNEIEPRHRKRMAFMLCHVIARINEAAFYWKKQHCDASVANFQKSFLFPMDKKKK
jgi:hypothetical protein